MNEYTNVAGIMNFTHRDNPKQELPPAMAPTCLPNQNPSSLFPTRESPFLLRRGITSVKKEKGKPSHLVIILSTDPGRTAAARWPAHRFPSPARSGTQCPCTARGTWRP